jgi:HPt (histidine-containing phosphotransfer) domain-containing protein
MTTDIHQIMSAMDTPGAGTTDIPVLDLRAIGEIRAVRVPGKPDLLGRVVKAFLEHTPRYLARLQAALDRQDSQAVAEVAHAMKSSSGTLGLSRVTRLCWILEQLGRSGSLAGIPELLSTLRAECGLAAVALVEVASVP